MTFRARTDAAQSRLRVALGEPPPRDRPTSLLAEMAPTDTDREPDTPAPLLSPALRAGAFDPKRAGVAALAALALVAAITAGVFALRARPRSAAVSRPPARVELVGSTPPP
ncbi:MAG: hypothetical protein ABIM89_08805, partial [Mycobacteriales bacterium]